MHESLELHKQVGPHETFDQILTCKHTCMYKVVKYTPGRGIHRDIPTGSVCVCVCVDINSHGDFNISSVHIYEPFQPFGIYIYTEYLKTRSTLYTVWLVY